jgi:hypothetical protein
LLGHPQMPVPGVGGTTEHTIPAMLAAKHV